MRWAVFDVDGTLFPPSSMEKTFILLMLKKGALSPQNIFYYFLEGTYRLFFYGIAEGFKSNKYYLRNLPVNPVRQEALKLIRKSIWPAISPTGKNHIRLYCKNHYKILIMSGSPDFLTYPLCQYLNPDYTIAADLEVRQSYFTGKLKGLHPYGKRKTILLQQLKNSLEIDFEESIVFANHHADYDHMNLFGKAVAVNPTPRLKTIAMKHHWPVENW
jgi:HAD superfamily phosphoserine phosphatase-like hydrolase